MAIDDEQKEIYSLLGYIPLWHYDLDLQEENDIWLSVWKTREDVPVSGLGIMVYYKLLSLVKPRTISAIGLSEVALNIYKRLRWQTGYLDQFYLLNNEMTEFKLVKNQADKNFAQTEQSTNELNATLVDKKDYDLFINNFSNITKQKKLPVKSAKYYWSRFVEHPFYNYNSYWLSQSGGQISGLLVTRVTEAENAKAIRIVDYYGDFDSRQNWLEFSQHILKEQSAEYMDFYMDSTIGSKFSSLGFHKRTNEHKIVIPNYFEPFEAKNVNISYGYNMKEELPYSIFKGDSDQDRPNIL